jgi:hypothetical protein
MLLLCIYAFKSDENLLWRSELNVIGQLEMRKSVAAETLTSIYVMSLPLTSSKQMVKNSDLNEKCTKIHNAITSVYECFMCCMYICLKCV